MEATTFNHVNPKILQSIAYHSHNRHLPAELVKLFTQDVGQLLVRFDQAWVDRDLAKLQFLAHRIKGSSLNVGAKSMAVTCATIERSLGEGRDWANISKEIQQLNSLLALTTREFGQMLHYD